MGFAHLARQGQPARKRSALVPRKATERQTYTVSLDSPLSIRQGSYECDIILKQRLGKIVRIFSFFNTPPDLPLIREIAFKPCHALACRYWRARLTCCGLSSGLSAFGQKRRPYNSVFWEHKIHSTSLRFVLVCQKGLIIYKPNAMTITVYSLRE